MKERICRDCNGTFTLEKGKAGRPHTRCESCREALAKTKARKAVEVKESLTGVEKVDRLEMMLRSRGLHISQWREKHEKD